MAKNLISGPILARLPQIWLPNFSSKFIFVLSFIIAGHLTDFRQKGELFALLFREQPQKIPSWIRLLFIIDFQSKKSKGLFTYQAVVNNAWFYKENCKGVITTTA